MTAVEWFYQRILAKDIEEVFEQAKEMEKQQIIDAYNNGDLRSADLYYNETYGSKGSDEIEKSEKPINLTSFQTEISDEEIEKQSDKQTSIEWLIKELKLEGYDHTIKVAKKMYDKEIDECSKKHSIQKINPSHFIDEMFKNAGKRD